MKLQIYVGKSGRRYFFLSEIANNQLYYHLRDKLNLKQGKVQGTVGFILEYTEENQKLTVSWAEADTAYLNAKNEKKQRAVREREKALQRREEERRLKEQARLEQKKQDLSVLENYRKKSAKAMKLKQSFSDNESFDTKGCLCDKLMQHQIVGARIGKCYDRYGFFFDTGTGKTLLGLEILRWRNLSERAHFLIICPKTIIETAWLDDCETFFPQMKILPVLSGMRYADYVDIYWRWREGNASLSEKTIHYFELGESKSIVRAAELLFSEAHHFITNPEKFRHDFASAYEYGYYGDEEVPQDYALPRYDRLVTGFIVDESAVLKNRDSILFKTISETIKSKKYVYLMSGKPAPNKMEEYETQIALLAPDLYAPWKARRSNLVGGAMGGKRELGLTDVLDMVSMTVSKHDCLDLPETTEMVRAIRLDTSARQTYLHVKYSTWQAIKDAETDQVFFMAGNFMKLRQVASGFLLNDGIATPVHDLKMKELEAVLDELGDNQVIIWCQFKEEIRKIEQILLKAGKTVVTAYGDTKDKNKSIRDFKTGLATYMVAHPATLKYGVTLVNCTYAIYYSISYSYEEYYQSHDRIYRKGQTMPCTYIFLLVENTIDMVMYEAIMKKKNRSEIVEAIRRHLSSDDDGDFCHAN